MAYIDKVRVNSLTYDVHDPLVDVITPYDTVGPAEAGVSACGLGDMPMDSVVVYLEPIQSGSGDPSPSNVRPISGHTSVSVTVSPTDDPEDGETYTTAIPTPPGTVYGGTLNMTTGELVSDMALEQMTYSYLSGLSSTYIGYNASVTSLGGKSAVWVRNWKYNDTPMIKREIKSGGIKGVCNAFAVHVHDRNINSTQYRIYFEVPSSITSVADFLAAVQTLENNGGGLYIAYELENPVSYQCEAQEIMTLAGTNTITSNAGQVMATVPVDVIAYVDSEIAAVDQTATDAAAVAATATADIATIRSDLDNLTETVDGIFNTPVTLTLNNGYIAANGSISAQSETNLEKYSDYFAVSPGDTLVITVTNPDGKANWVAVGQRTRTDSWVSRAQIIGTTDSSTEKTVEYMIPENVGKVSLTFRTYGSITVSAINTRPPYYTSSEGVALEGRVAALETEDTALDGRVTAVESDCTDLDGRVTALESGGTKVNVVRPHSKVYATNHRGWYQCPENTLIAYRQSAIHGFPQVETDVRFTSDGVPVLLHDASINRTARNADGSTIEDTIAINSITLAEALEYDFGIYKGSSYAGEKIPTLEQFLKCCRDCGLIPYVEIEGTLTAEQAAIIAGVVNKSGIRNDVVFIANYTASLVSMQPYFPSNRYGVSPWTYSDTHRQAAIALFNNKAEVFMHMAYNQVTSEILAALQASNIPLEIWTVNSAAILAADGYVSGFTSNETNAVTVLYNNATT